MKTLLVFALSCLVVLGLGYLIFQGLNLLFNGRQDPSLQLLFLLREDQLIEFRGENHP